MLSANAYSFRQKSKLAISLSWIGGYTDTVALLVCGTMVSHMSGISSTLGRSVGETQFHVAAFLAFVLGTFLVGNMLSAVMTETARRRGLRSKYLLPITCEAALLALFAVGQITGNPEAIRLAPPLWMVGVAALAMGLQNGAITHISGEVVRTTHVTGVVTDLGLQGVAYLFWCWDRRPGSRPRRTARVIRASSRHPTFLRVLLLGSILVSFIFGAAAAALLDHHDPTAVMLPPVAFLLFLVGVDLRKPIADVRELDLLGDPELRVGDVVQAMLGPEIGVYRVGYRRNAPHRAPNFRNWADRLPPHRRVVILAIGTMTRFDENAVLDLREAARQLRGHGRSLVIAGVTGAHYRLFTQFGLTEVIGDHALCPDLEFAIARSLTLAPSHTEHAAKTA